MVVSVAVCWPVQLAVDVNRALEEAGRCNSRFKTAASDIAHLQKTMPQVVGVLRDALKVRPPSPPSRAGAVATTGKRLAC